MARKRQAEDSPDDTSASVTSIASTSTTLTDRPNKRPRRTLAIDYLFNNSSSPYISSSTSPNLNSPTEPSTPLWTAANKISQPRIQSLSLRQRSWYAPIFKPSPTSLLLPTLDSTQPHRDNSPLPKTQGLAERAQGIATYILPSGHPTPLPRSYATSALLAAKKCRGGISEIVYDASFADEESGWRLDNGFSSTGASRHGVREGCEIEGGDATAGRVGGGGYEMGRMSASQRVFGTYALIERILLEGEEGGEVVRRMGGVSRTFRHVVKRSVGVRRRVDGSSRL
ncbi:unnamed protein product [Zymoseptoria tritici ST99CH_3D7]|uniref:Uncharacterized protein n=1 Tax=Zymoseptoria tritici (strain ST99CH_3D7) TaxID=1276538 RepID=A0A1X7S813_ZYMT9|nr:unnamed protein product [Zymoseptoria tritici ST99CH_3D7]